MRVPLMKVAAGAAMLAAAAVATPAMAGGYYGGGWGHGGYYGGGYHGGGWGGGWWGPAAVGGVLGLATGAIIASQAQYPAYYAPPPNCWQPRALYDQWGCYIGRQMVNVCQ